ncbi:MAG: single-stranded-DNA-specific exonuclease RecJ [Planctomycetota bacterium]|jgi:single-stranded-DNA-specific exonuclease
MPATDHRTRWRLRKPAPARRGRLADELRVSTITAQLLLNRDIAGAEEARRFMAAHFDDIHDPGLLPDVGIAVERLIAAVSERQHVIVYGDSDADGLAATAIVTRLLTMLGCRVETFIPGRLTDGYGLSADTVERLIFARPDLVVTVDCGITSREEVARLREAAIDVIVTDHHEPGEEIPQACAVVAARRPGSAYPFRDLSGAGVAFKLCWALAQALSPGKRVSAECREFLNEATALVALGTVADVCPLRDENRVLVRYGLKAISASRRPGLAALLGAARRRGSYRRALTARDVAWSLGPVINAAGRLGRPETALELLLADEAPEAERLAAELVKMNNQRRVLGRAIASDAMEAAAAESDAPALVLSSDSWHGGVLGPAANKVTERFGRPAVLVAFDGDVGRGSARAPKGSRLHELLAACSEHLEAHGGHDGAAGFTVTAARFEAFKKAFLEAAEKALGAGTTPQPEIAIEAEVPAAELTRALADEVNQLRPFGEGSPEAILASLGMKLAGVLRTIGSGRSLSFRVRNGTGSIRCVGFGMASKILDIQELGKAGRLDLAYKLSGSGRGGEPELIVEDFRPGA